MNSVGSERLAAPLGVIAPPGSASKQKGDRRAPGGGRVRVGNRRRGDTDPPFTSLIKPTREPGRLVETRPDRAGRLGT
ncbi:hypothetical protein EYF80_064597 [Liparis tanakae]|uniref:Uncharacterized protein n=1 Tax=Liparis tanakae TaxID=230148 RepID=A0A4Z2E933_9TELE|nr:hypothetical protein EYF80_064597 [Liparis tanakae]